MKRVRSSLPFWFIILIILQNNAASLVGEKVHFCSFNLVLAPDDEEDEEEEDEEDGDVDSVIDVLASTENGFSFIEIRVSCTESCSSKTE